MIYVLLLLVFAIMH